MEQCVCAGTVQPLAAQASERGRASKRCPWKRRHVGRTHTEKEKEKEKKVPNSTSSSSLLTQLQIPAAIHGLSEKVGRVVQILRL